MTTTMTTWRGQERSPIPGSSKNDKPAVGRYGPRTNLARCAADRVIEATVVLPLKKEMPITTARMTRDELVREHGPTEADWKRLDEFALEHGLSVGSQELAFGTARVAGQVKDMEEAFGTELYDATYEAGQHRMRVGQLSVLPKYDGLFKAVIGLDDRQAARCKVRRVAQIPRAGSGAVPLLASQLAAAYSFPASAGPGPRQACLVVELGGGYSQADYDVYYSKLGIRPSPTLAWVSVAGGRNQMDGPGGADGEVDLDMQVIGTACPEVLQVAAFCPNTDPGFLAGVSYPISNPTVTVAGVTYHFGAVSVSWGSRGSQWTPQSRLAMDRAIQMLLALGITFCPASGDDGSSDDPSGIGLDTDYPAESPWAWACGGSRVMLKPDGTIQAETAWGGVPGNGAGGGGYSTRYARPTYQDQAHKNPGRGSPDCCLNADPATGYIVRVDGEDTAIGGTSGAAPLMAAGICRANTWLKQPIGDLHAIAYAHPECFRDCVAGTNGAYSCRAGWDEPSGLGSPIFSKIIEVLNQGAPSPPPGPPPPPPPPPPATIHLTSTEARIARQAQRAGLQVTVPAKEGARIGID